MDPGDTSRSLLAALQPLLSLCPNRIPVCPERRVGGHRFSALRSEQKGFEGMNTEKKVWEAVLSSESRGNGLWTAGGKMLVSCIISGVEMGLKIVSYCDQESSEMGMTKVRDSKKGPLP